MRHLAMMMVTGLFALVAFGPSGLSAHAFQKLPEKLTFEISGWVGHRPCLKAEYGKYGRLVCLYYAEKTNGCEETRRFVSALFRAMDDVHLLRQQCLLVGGSTHIDLDILREDSLDGSLKNKVKYVTFGTKTGNALSTLGENILSKLNIEGRCLYKMSDDLDENNRVECQ
ncbi:MAG: hypothetical protein OXB88_00010 [Bacteriovoracales bacterium]|nr:hypothetical protein [Bacteriovoracales bacterium]